MRSAIFFPFFDWFLLPGCHHGPPPDESLRPPPELSSASRAADVETGRGGLPEHLVNSAGMCFHRVEPVRVVTQTGHWRKPGLSLFAQSAGSASEFEPHPDDLRLDRPFLISCCEVLRSEFERVVGRRPADDLRHWSVGDTPDKPAVRVSLEEAEEFCRRLSRLPAERAALRTYRLPTIAEWLHARVARATDYFPCFPWLGHMTVHEWTSGTDENGDPVTAVAWSHPAPFAAVVTFRVVVESPVGER